MVKQSFPKFTEAGIAELRSRIGVERELRDGHNTEASLDNIRRFAHGIGDDNPLWLDREYAKDTRWGDIIAPPCFVRSFGIARPEKLSGVHAQFAGEEFRFCKPMRLGDQITAVSRLIDVVEKQSQFAKRTLLEMKEVIYRDHQDDNVATAVYTFIRHERDTAAQRGKYREVQPKTWTPEELRNIDEAYSKATRRGATPRYWEDVQIGDTIEPRVKGPLTVMDIIWGFMGEGGMPFSYAFDMAYKLRTQHPGMFVLNTQGAFETIASCHWDWEFAQRIGAPGPYDVTSQRIACLAHAVTDWMGDDGWLKTLKGQSRRFMVLGDVMWYQGKVTERYVVDGEHVVALELWGENQRGEVTVPGSAEVVLPSRQPLPGSTT